MQKEEKVWSEKEKIESNIQVGIQLSHQIRGGP